MAILGGKGTVGVGAAFAAFLLMKGLLNHLVRSGLLREEDRNAIVDDALTEVSSVNNANHDDTRTLLNSVKQPANDV